MSKEKSETELALSYDDVILILMALEDRKRWLKYAPDGGKEFNAYFEEQIRAVDILRGKINDIGVKLCLD